MVSSQAVDSGPKDRKDGEKVSRELFFGAEISLIENHEFPALDLEHLLNEFGPKPCKTVSVGDHNSELISRVNSFQYGEKSSAPEVESGADVTDDLGVRISLSHERDLSLKVRRLLLGRDAAVADGDSGFCIPDV